MLQLAIKLRDYDKLKRAVDEFKKYKLADTDGHLYKAERIMLEFVARDGQLCVILIHFCLVFSLNMCVKSRSIFFSVHVLQ